MSAILRCEISGELVSGVTDPKDPMVVTPSGHIAKRRLLLSKLVENGGIDPFVNGTEAPRPLSEDDLIELQIPITTTSVPRVGKTDMTNMLQQIQAEYDAVLLELYDTRKQLQQTRQELTQALYQNDAAVRVIARIAAERDTARNMLLQRNHSTATTTNGGSTVVATTTVGPEEPASKRPRTEVSESNNDATVTTTNNSSNVAIPSSDLDIMLSTWQELHSNRKARQKAASKQAVSTDILSTKYKATTIDSVGDFVVASTTTGSGRYVAASTSNSDLIAITDKKIATLLKDSLKIDENFILEISPSDSITSIDSRSTTATGDSIIHVVGLERGNIVLYQNTTQLGSLTALSDSKQRVVDVRVHPDLVHIVAATANGIIGIAGIDSTNVTPTVGWVANFTNDASNNYYTTGALHPDGLIYIAGTANGELHIWDFKNQTCAERLINNNDDATTSAVTSVTISNNGYHVAASYLNNTVLVWDLRKLNILATFNNKADDTSSGPILAQVQSIEFDDSGKYLAYSGVVTNVVTVSIINVKDWSFITSLRVEPQSSSSSSSEITSSPGIVWGIDNKISLVWDNTSSTEEVVRRRSIAVFGVEG